jgi:hypothetical protein
MWKVDSVSGSWCTGVPPKKNAEILPVIYAKRKKLGNNCFFLRVCEIIFFFFCSGTGCWIDAQPFWQNPTAWHTCLTCALDST